MKKFFQNIKFKKVSLTTLALALVVSGFLVWGNTEAEVSTDGINVDSPTSSNLIYAKDGDASIPVQIDITTDATGSGKIRVEILPGIGDTTWFDHEFAVAEANNNIAINVPLNSGISEGTYDLKVSAQQPGGTGVVRTITVADVVVIDNTLPTVESVSVNDESIAEGDAGTDKFVVTVNFTDANPMDETTNPTIAFDPALDTTITNCSNSWTDPDTFTYTCDIADVNIETAGIDVLVSGAKDAAGNTMSGTFTESDEFDVDTVAPTVTATISPSTGTKKVGDTITATLTAGESQADLSLSGTCTINGVDVTDSFVNNTGGTYTLSYEIGEAEADQASGDLPVSCTLAETSGNTVTLSSFEENTLTVDANSPAAPSITSIAGDGKINDSEKAAVTIVGTAEANATISGSLTGTGEPVAVSGTADGDGNFSITVNASGLDDGTLSLSVTATDAAGNESVAGTSSAVKDIVAPVGYSVSFDQDYVNSSNETAISFTFAGAEEGATYNYSINDADAAVTGTWSISTATDQITGIDVSSLDDETLTITVTLTDPAGNAGTGVTDTIVKETVAPVISTVTSDATGAGVLKVGDTITFTVTMNATEAGLTIAPTAYNGGTLEWSTTDSGATYTATYTVAEGQNDQGTALQLTGVTATDTFGNTSAAVSGNDVTGTIDANSPAAPSITSIAGDGKINDSEKAAVIIVGTAEANATISGSLTGTGGTVTVSGTADGSGDFSITVDASELSDGTLSLSITATDTAGNESGAGTSSAEKDIVAPTGYSVAFDQDYANDANKAAISFTFTDAEVGATYNYSIDDTNGSTLAITNTGTITSATDQITGINVSTLDDETLTITVTLTDPAGNVGAGGTNTITKDTSDPTITGATIDPNAGTAIIGGTITATLTAGGSQADLTVGVCTINEVDVSGNFTNVGDGIYTIAYQIADGETDRTTGALPINCTLSEPSGNEVTVSAFTDGNALAIDANSPTVTSITFNDTALKIGETATVTIVMSEAVTGFDKTDVTAPNGTLGVLSTEDDITFTGTFTPTASIEAPTNVATVGTGFTDVAGNNASAGATSANYTIDTVAPTLPDTGIVGTTIQGAGDQIILTFSEAVSPVDETWSADEFDIESPDGSTIDITRATFSPTSGATTILTITLDEDSTEDDTYLRNGNTISVTSANGAIVDAAGNFVANSEVDGSVAISGDVLAPTLASIAYTQGETPVTVIKPSTYGLVVRVTATFSELMHSAPRIAIDAPGTDADMEDSPLNRTSGTVWYKDWTVPNIDAVQGLATITLSGTDLAGEAFNSASTSSVTIDERGPVIQNGGIILDKDSYRVTQDPNVTVTVIEDNTAESVTVNGVNATETATSGTWTGTFAHSKGSIGTYSFDVVATDANGNATKIQSSSYRIIEDDEVPGTGSFGIVSKTMTKMTGTADNTYENGWEWVIRVTLPTDQNSFALKFSDWVSGANTMAAGGNMQYYSEQIASGVGSSASPIAITAANTYPSEVVISTDVDPTLDGIQTDIHVQVKIPATTPAGSYSTSFQASYDAPGID